MSPSLLSGILKTLAVAICSALLSTSIAQAELLAPFKDDLFAYPHVLRQADDGRYMAVDYRSKRDINQRDEIPERRVNGRYVDLSVRRDQQDLLATTEVARMPHMAVGRQQNARFIVVYLYGQGGNRRQGMDDFTFGGNFNRIKNLAARNGGLYLTTDFSDFGATGARQVASLISLYAAHSPQASVFVACGSMGGGICWRLADNERVAPRLGGLLLLGSHWDEGFLSSRAFKRKVPVFFGHGGEDRVFPVEQQEHFFRSILQKSPGYPARFVRFETGSHGTPIRMSDWRGTLNWMDASR
ncbi:alpha/beta hydrolase [Neoaquamicrobium sediminum]|uniref:alpha/beta hydrolase n=1 Tax=Neoaquamicrobium sediminum TaxID=1849104 RepID=UPI003BAC0D94